MQIGELTLEIVKPENLDAQLVASTGCFGRRGARSPHPRGDRRASSLRR
jgi:hypothetical protein